MLDEESVVDAFFQKLRKIQKKEINESGLARVGDDFYPKVHSYIDMLMDKLESNPFAEEEHRLLQNTQRIATDICSRREHKISDTAVNNIQRSYHLFQGKKPQFDSHDTTPLNLTPEEEQLYFALMDTVRNHRKRLLPSLDILGSGENISAKGDVSKPVNNQTYLFETGETEPVVDILKEETPKQVEKEVKLDSVSEQGSVINPMEEVKLDVDTHSSEAIETPKPVEKVNEISKTSKPIISDNKSVEKRSEFKKELDQSESDHKDDNLNDIYSSIYADEEFIDLPPEVPIKPFKINKTHNNEFDSDKISFKTLVVFDEVPSIVGVDEKVYGPFYPQDVVKMPELNAKLFRKRRKGRLVKI